MSTFPRCTVVVPTGITSERYIRAWDNPGNPELTHHIVINADESGVVSNDLRNNGPFMVILW